jgi:hypothetical protein
MLKSSCIRSEISVYILAFFSTIFGFKVGDDEGNFFIFCGFPRKPLESIENDSSLNELYTAITN